jgi:ribokinase
MHSFDFLAIGDITTDIFIKLIDATISCDLGHENCMISLHWGDKIPFESSTLLRGVGNSANAAVSAARLGVSTSLLAWVGDDENGRGCIEEMKQNNVDTSEIHPDSASVSNQHYVLWYGSERTILVKQNPFPYALPAGLAAPRYMYLSSLGDSLPFHQELAAWLAAHPETKLVFQPGTFQMKMGTDVLADLYAHTEHFFCNKEDAERILKLPADTTVPTLLTSIRALGPKIVVITDDTKGAYAYDGTEMLKVPMYPDQKPPFERTGAGDAFASTVTAALILGKPLAEALLWGPVNSMSVVQEVGAQKGLLSREKLEAFLAEAPESYKVTPLATD